MIVQCDGRQQTHCEDNTIKINNNVKWWHGVFCT